MAVSDSIADTVTPILPNPDNTPFNICSFKDLREESAAVAGSGETLGRLKLLAPEGKPLRHGHRVLLQADILFLKHASSIFRHSSNPVCGSSIMEQVRLCAVWPTENWGSIQLT